MMEMNGQPVTPEEIRALGLYNYGHFTSMRVEQMRVRGLTLHMERLARDTRKLFGVGLDIDRVRHQVRAFAERNESPLVVRVTIFDSETDMNHPGRASHPDILISARPAPVGAIPPLRVESVHYQREMPSVKHVGLFGSLSHRRASQLRGFDDSLFIDDHSRVSEGPTWNIGFFDGSQIIWPKADVLPGVTLNLVKKVVAGSGMTSTDSIVHISQISETWAAFAMNIGVGVRPIQSIDAVELLDDSPVVRNLQLQYAAISGDPL